MKTKDELKKDGFTESGVDRYEKTVKEYSNTLHSKSINFGEADKATDLPREVTHDHVRAAAYTIAKSYGKQKLSPWMVASQVAEYVFTALGSFALGKTTESWSTPLFVGCAVIAGILVAVRLSRSK